MPTFIAKLTTAGAALYTAALVSGTPVPLTAMAVGDGNGNPITVDPAMTALVRERHRSNLSSIEVDNVDPHLLFAEMIIPPNIGGWAIREVGLYTSSGVLFAIANFPDTYKPVIADGSSRDLVIQFGLKLSNASAITLVVDASIVGATRQWVLSTVTPAALFPGGTTHQILRKKSNANGDTEWADPTDVNVTVDVIKEIQTAAGGQDVFTLAVCTTDGVAVYIEGAREFHFTVLNSTQVQLAAGLTAGIEVMFVQNEPNEPLQIRRTITGRAYFLGQLA